MEFVFTLGLVALLGWLLGVVGFFRAGSAMAEVRRLRQEILLAQTVAPAQMTTAPATMPAPAPDVAETVDDAVAPKPDPAAAVTDGIAEAFASATGTPGPAAAATPRKNSLEETLTQRLGLWVGAAALLLAAVFLLRIGIEEGWLGPASRTAMAALLGFALVAIAEKLRGRPPAGAAADRAPAALASGGVAALFGAAYAAGPLYALVPPPVDLLLLGLAGLAGMLLALRYGPFVGVVGLVGAYVTPALVQSTDPFLPGLYAYLLAVTAAAAMVVRFTAWTPLGAMAALGAAFWVAAGSRGGTPEALWVPALFAPAAAAVLLFALPRGVGAVTAGRMVAAWAVLAPGIALLPIPGLIEPPLLWAGGLAISALCLAAIIRASPEPGLVRLPWFAAAIALVAFAFWPLPAWSPTGETVAIEGATVAFFAGDWTPESLRPFLGWLAGLAALHFGAGFVLAGRAARPSGWAGLGAAVPVLLLLIGFGRVRAFQPDPLWACLGLALAALLVFACTRAMRRGDVTQAGEWAAGAVGALALAAGMLLTDQWLSAALGLLLPALAWIERRTGVAALRPIAATLAVAVLVRLVLNPTVAAYDVGTTPVFNGLAIAYLVPAFSAALAARILTGEDKSVTCLRAMSLIAAIVGVLVLIRHGMTGRLDDADPSFAELAASCGALWLLAAMLAALQARRPLWVRGFVLAWLAAAALILLTGLVVLNPGVTDVKLLGGAVVWNPLLAAYAVPGVLAGLAAVLMPTRGRLRRWLAYWLGGVAVLAGLVWVTLEVRRGWHGVRVAFDAVDFTASEHWAVSGGWLALALTLFGIGLASGRRGLRLAALAVMGAATMKVFVVDMAEMDGLWRVLSLLGLGLALIGLGTAYRRFVAVAPKT